MVGRQLVPNAFWPGRQLPVAEYEKFVFGSLSRNKNTEAVFIASSPPNIRILPAGSPIKNKNEFAASFAVCPYSSVGRAAPFGTPSVRSLKTKA
jgi:hypothetical protein